MEVAHLNHALKRAANLIFEKRVVRDSNSRSAMLVAN